MTTSPAKNERSDSGVEEAVYAMLRDFAPEPSEALDISQMDLIEDLGYHSLALVELAYTLEDVFLLEPIGFDEIEDVRSCGDLAKFIVGKAVAVE